MQKKMIGILAGVASIHAVVLTGLLVSGGCTQTEILAPHAYVNGPEIAGNENAAEQPAPAAAETPEAPIVPGAEPAVEPMAPAPAPAVVPEPAPASAPAPAQGGTYTVQKGDNLTKIAHKYGMRPNDLAAYNNLTGKAADSLKVGQKLNIPAGGTYTAPKSAQPVVAKTAKPAKTTQPAATAARPADGIYVVKKGDSLDRIARRYGTTSRAIAAENNMDVNKTLRVGEKLRLPAAGSKAPAAVSAAPATAVAPAAPTAPVASTPVAAPAPQPVAAAPIANTEMLELPRDMTLAEFSNSSGVSEATLRQLNPQIPADGQLRAGMYLVIPQSN